MQDVLASGIELILWLQSAGSPGLDRFFEVFTNFGGSYYLYMFPFLFWCVDYRLAARLAPVFALTLLLNTALKEWIEQPRPFEMDERIVSDGERGYGLPSGHAQLVVVFWGMIAAWVERPWFWALSILIMFLMGLSRVYLGVHFPSDVIAGWVLGALCLWVALDYRSSIEAWLGELGLGGQVAVSLGVGVFALVFDALLVQDHTRLDPGVAGFLAGCGVGAAVARQRLHFDGRGVWWQRVLRYVLGVPLTLLMIGGFQALGAPEGFVGNVVIALDLAVLGLWLSLIAPWLFELVRLSTPADTR